MIKKLIVLGTALILFWSCGQNEKGTTGYAEKPLTEFSDYYSRATAENLYSNHVGDTFKIFKSLPKGYSNESGKKYPLVIILDGNAFFESVVSEMKFNTFIGLIPKSIIVGIGYKDFQTMDSLRSRNYTYPTAIPEYEMDLSGGAENFKRFIDEELIPKLTRENKIDIDKSVICGHSLAGYFTLFYGLKSIEDNSFTIRNIVSASPSLHYNHRFIFDMEEKLMNRSAELKLYISMGTEDMADEESKGILESFEKQIQGKNYHGLKLKAAEFTNFGHIDAAIPGFIKGLTFVFEN
ncbi:MAG: alpha/beta hydrolase-fold protein [Cyclobacteriaceae bacterium]|nr:MAG: alpha/beta hydrolase-fold protein [Cyclobacteriaceae bacterium]